MKCPKCGSDLELDIKIKGVATWRKEPASKAQLDKLEYLGVRHNKNITKGEASDLIDFHLKNP